jgi:hypothetical protein|uniref:Autophagy-related protein n=1 Tax=viral metagenome TaxID=1070528 RepID=A0A6C0AN53_9ZZZZ
MFENELNTNTNNTDTTNESINNSTNIKQKTLIDFSKSEFNLNEKRIVKKEVELIKEKYPKYIPILIRSTKIKFTQHKYLVNEEVTVSQFMTIIKKKILLKAYEAIYLFINNTIPQGSSQLNSLYRLHKDSETDMLIITVCKENTFG